MEKLLSPRPGSGILFRNNLNGLNGPFYTGYSFSLSDAEVAEDVA